jgi:hypothetical protein
MNGCARDTHSFCARPIALDLRWVCAWVADVLELATIRSSVNGSKLRSSAGSSLSAGAWLIMRYPILICPYVEHIVNYVNRQSFDCRAFRRHGRAAALFVLGWCRAASGV